GRSGGIVGHRQRGRVANYRFWREGDVDGAGGAGCKRAAAGVCPSGDSEVGGVCAGEADDNVRERLVAGVGEGNGGRLASGGLSLIAEGNGIGRERGVGAGYRTG